MNNGYIKIKTKIDNSEVDKDIQQLENKINKLQNTNEEINKAETSLQEEINNYELLHQKAEKYKNKIKELNIEKAAMFKQNPNLSVGKDTPEYSKVKADLEEIKQKYENTTKEIDKQAPKIEKVYNKLEKIKSIQEENNSKITIFQEKIKSVNTNNIQKSLNEVGRNISSQISRIGKVALAVIGIRTAWNAVRSTISSVSQYNKPISTDFEYMRYVVSNMLAPAVQWLVRLLYTVLSYVNAIANGWFGINLFGNSSVKNFQKMQNSASGTAKSAKEIQKSLQGFDEMNILQDNTDTSDSSTGGVTAPSVDLSGIQANIPKWLQWIIDNKDIIISVFAGITAGIIALKLGLGGLKALGIGILITEVVQLIQDVIKYIADPSFDNFLNILRDIALIIATIGILIGAWPLVIGAIIALIVIEIVKHWDEIKSILGQVGQWIYDNVLMPTWGFIQKVINAILAYIEFGISVINGIFTVLIGILLAPFQTLWEMVQGVFSGIVEIVEGIGKVFKGIFTGDIKTVLEGFKQIFKGIFDSLWTIAKAPLNLIIRGINALISGANKIKLDVPDWVPVIGGKTLGFNIPTIPLLAKGGIISQPTQAIVGEAGTEAVVPLENNLEWLDLLADKLASRIENKGGTYVINIDGRKIQRGMAKRKNQLSFATNGG